MDGLAVSSRLLSVIIALSTTMFNLLSVILFYFLSVLIDLTVVMSSIKFFYLY